MKIQINIDKDTMHQLGPYAFFILIYLKAIYLRTSKVSSFNQTSKDLGLSYIKTRQAFARIYSILFLHNNKYQDSYIYLKEKTGKAYETLKGVNARQKQSGKKIKGIEQERIWKYIVSKVQPHFRKKIPAKFYWKINVWINNLIKLLGRDKKKLDDYIKWFIFNKKDSITGNFNAGIFCCDGMVKEYLNNIEKNNEDTRKRIKEKKEKFIQQMRKQNIKLLDRIVLKISEGKKLDKYDLENLKYLKKEGYYIGEV